MSNGAENDIDGNLQVNIYPTYRSDLADAIFPGDDFYARQMRSDFSEMLGGHVAGGGSVELTVLGAALAAFTPARVSNTTHPVWKDRSLERWELTEKPMLFAGLEAYYLDGGLDRRLAEIGRLYSELRAAGVRFGDEQQMLYRVGMFGDWRATFIGLASFGRRDGIRLTLHGDDLQAVSAALRGAGFSHEQQLRILANLNEADPEASPTGAQTLVARKVFAAFWRDLWARLVRWLH